MKRTLSFFVQQAAEGTLGYSGRIRLKSLRGDGSDRKIFRLFTGERTYIAVDYPQGCQGRPSENDSFHYIAGHLQQQGLPVPRIYAFDPLGGRFLLEDFGDISLEERIRREGDPSFTVNTYQEILNLLVQIQVRGGRGFDPRYCYDTPDYNGEFAWERETRYFMRAFLFHYLGRTAIPPALEEELKDLAFQVDREALRLFLYRDFQSRNIMVRDFQSRIMVSAFRFGLIDFQGGRMGPPQYDLASLLIDPYVRLPWEVQERLLGVYLQRLSREVPVDSTAFLNNYQFIALQRNLQILGAFAFLSRVKGKTYFEEYIPAALDVLKKRMREPVFKPYKQTGGLVRSL